MNGFAGLAFAEGSTQLEPDMPIEGDLSAAQPGSRFRPAEGHPGTRATATSLSAYLAEIARVPLLSAEEETRLARGVACGDHEAKARLIEANLRLVVALAREYRGRGLTLADLIQEGSLGLILAAERFDHRRSLRFSTYAGWLIRGAILQALANKTRLIRLPERARSILARLAIAEAELSQELRRVPSSHELAVRIGIDVRELEAVLLSAQPPWPLVWHAQSSDDPTTEQDDTLNRWSETAAPTADEVASALAEIPARERAVLELRFGLDGSQPRTRRQIGEMLGLSCERIRQIETQALANARQALRRSL